MGPRTGLDCAENLTPTGIRSPDSPARSESLYRLSYRAHFKKEVASSFLEYSYGYMDIFLPITQLCG
jgi:hypothetical protein